MSQENDGFTTGAREKFPNLHADYQQVGEFASWPQNALERLYAEYTDFVKRDDLMPRAANSADTILAHLAFELAYREGIYGES